MKDKVSIPHTGKWEYHDDDCWCVLGNNYCNRDDWVWSCCGACKKDSDCSGKNMHPTYWKHDKFPYTIKKAGENGSTTFVSNEKIKKISPESFE